MVKAIMAVRFITPNNAFENWFDRADFSVTTSFADPGAFEGFALEDTIRISVSGNGNTLDGIENYTGLALDGDEPTAGTLTAVFATVTQGGDTRTLVSLTGLNWDAVEIFQVGQTATRADDAALFASAFSGNDTFELSEQNDTARGYSGKDVLNGNGGADKLAGDAGADALFGGRGNDRLTGGDGEDRLAGGAGRDVFVFGSGDGKDEIRGFTNGDDRIEITSGAATFADVRVLDAGTSVVVRFADVTVTLLNVDFAKINAGDFLFG